MAAPLCFTGASISNLYCSQVSANRVLFQLRIKSPRYTAEKNDRFELQLVLIGSKNVHTSPQFQLTSGTLLISYCRVESSPLRDYCVNVSCHIVSHCVTFNNRKDCARQVERRSHNSDSLEPLVGSASPSSFDCTLHPVFSLLIVYVHFILILYSNLALLCFVCLPFVASILSSCWQSF